MTYKQALHSYQRAHQSAMSPKYMEKAVFARAISMLKRAQENLADYQAYAAALKFNQQLWTLIQSNLAESGDGVPAEIRANLLNLSLFIDRRTINALAAPGADKLDALIEIDIDISRGLDSRSAVSVANSGENLPAHGFLPN